MRKDGNADPDELSNLFVEITDDLSYARTFYPRRSVRVYLNNLAQSVFNSLYKLKKDPFGNFIRFWKTSLPVELYRTRKFLYVSFLVFTIAILIGIVSTTDDLNFSRIILGDDYVDMTDSFIENGDPMAVYKQEGEFPMFVRLFLNNIRVAFLTFIAGLLFCAGTGLVLFTNGIMIGTFHTYFYLKELAIGKSLLMTSLLTVWIHGTFEIFSIVVSGAAGFIAGMSLIYPGNYTRMQSFQIGMKQGMKIMIGISPFIFFAAILEGYVTRHTEMPDALKIAIILLSFIIFVFYFLIYPFIVARKNHELVNAPPEPLYRPVRKPELYKIKPIQEMVADSFIIFRTVYSKYARYLWGIIIPLHLLLAGYLFLNSSEKLNYHDLNVFDHLQSMLSGNSPVYFLIASFLFSLSLTLPAISLQNYEENGNHVTFLKTLQILFTKSIVAYPFMFLFLSVMYIQEDLTLLLFIVLAPAIIYIPSAIQNSTKSGFTKVSDGFNYYISQFGNNYGLFFLVSFILGGIFMLTHSSVYGFIEEIIEWHTITQLNNYALFINFIHTSVYIIFFHHFFVFLATAFGIAFYVNTEIRESVSLFRKIKKFGTTSKTREKNNTV